MFEENERLLLSISFTAKFELVFALTQEKVYFSGLVLKSTERAKVPLKNSARDFKTALRLRDRHVFM